MQIPIQQIDSPIFEIKVKTVKKQSYFRPRNNLINFISYYFAFSYESWWFRAWKKINKT